MVFLELPGHVSLVAMGLRTKILFASRPSCTAVRLAWWKDPLGNALQKANSSRPGRLDTGCPGQSQLIDVGKTNITSPNVDMPGRLAAGGWMLDTCFFARVETIGERGNLVEATLHDS